MWDIFCTIDSRTSWSAGESVQTPITLVSLHARQTIQTRCTRSTCTIGVVNLSKIGLFIYKLFYLADPLVLGNLEDLQLLECQRHPEKLFLDDHRKFIQISGIIKLQSLYLESFHL